MMPGDSLRYWIDRDWITTSDPRGLYTSGCGVPPDPNGTIIESRIR